MKVLSLFSGAGGLDIGFERAGFEIVGAVENAQHAVATLLTNRPHWPVLAQDVRRYEPSEALADVLIAGPPCQGYSTGGLRIPSAAQNVLYLEVLRIASVVQPRVLLIENVPGIRSMRAPGRKHTFEQKICRALRGLGYRVRTVLLDLSLYGVPQKRRRVFFLASTLPIPHTIFNLSPSPGRIYDWIPDAPGPMVRLDRNSANRLFPLDSAGPTIDSGRFAWKTATGIVPLTLLELARLQTFDPAWKFCGGISSVRSQISNAVPPHFAAQLAVRIWDLLNSSKEKTPSRPTTRRGLETFGNTIEDDVLDRNPL